MLSNRHHKLLEDMLSLPTAPFTEDAVRQYIFDFCQGRSALKIGEDKVGNILVHYKRGTRRRPVCFCAHMDHPGFRAGRMIGPRRLKARWLGGVPPEYFKNARVRFHSDGQWIKGRVTSISLKTLGLERPHKAVDSVEVELSGRADQQVRLSAPGMWDLPDPQVRGQRIHARACDDLAGCGAMLAALDQLLRRRVQTEAYFLFTRAEEVGFIGAIAACRLRTIPMKCLVVAIETSSVLPGVTMGGGPILRIGDKSSVFTPELSAWCGQVATQLQHKDRKFTFQRKLMDGGSCESSAYCELGYDATGVCIALGNYHNCDRQRQRIASEYVDLHDLANMIKWFEALAASRTELGTAQAQFRKRLGQLERRYKRLLSSTS